MSMAEADNAAQPVTSSNGDTPHVNGNTVGNAPQASSQSEAAPAAQDSAAYGGYCEIESDPAFFNVMLKELGVSGIKVQETWSRSYEDFFEMPQPIHGLIFLFRYHADPEAAQETSCPSNLWFANQTQEQLCATLAILNILNNVPGADLGPHLQSFKEFTTDFTPALRGDAVCNFEFMKSIHNSFARKLDMLNIDLVLKNKHDKSQKKRKQAPVQSSGTTRKKRKLSKEDDYVDCDDAAFHYIAFVPINGQVWKLDGVDRQPSLVDVISEREDWLQVALTDIEKRIARYADDVNEFGLLAMVHDPIDDCKRRLILNMKKLRTVHEHLDEFGDGWKMQESAEDQQLMKSTILGPESPIFEITKKLYDGAMICDEFQVTIEGASPGDLLKLRRDIAESQKTLRKDLQEALDQSRSDQEKADQHRFDYGPILETWMRMLAEKEGLLQEIVSDIKV